MKSTDDPSPPTRPTLQLDYASPVPVEPDAVNRRLLVVLLSFHGMHLLMSLMLSDVLGWREYWDTGWSRPSRESVVVLALSGISALCILPAFVHGRVWLVPAAVLLALACLPSIRTMESRHWPTPATASLILFPALLGVVALVLVYLADADRDPRFRTISRFALWGGVLVLLNAIFLVGLIFVDVDWSDLNALLGLLTVALMAIGSIILVINTTPRNAAHLRMAIWLAIAGFGLLATFVEVFVFRERDREALVIVLSGMLPFVLLIGLNIVAHRAQSAVARG